MNRLTAVEVEGFEFFHPTHVEPEPRAHTSTTGQSHGLTTGPAAALEAAATSNAPTPSALEAAAVRLRQPGPGPT